MSALRRKASVLFAACLLFLLLGVWAYQAEQERVLAAMGATVPVLVTTRGIEAWSPMLAADVTVQEIPRRYAGEGYLSEAAQVVGRVLVADVPEGAALASYLLHAGPYLQPGERSWELRQSASLLLDSQLKPGDRVDVLAAGTSGEQERIHAVATGARVLSVRTEQQVRVATLAVTWEQALALMEAELRPPGAGAARHRLC